MIIKPECQRMKRWGLHEF